MPQLTQLPLVAYSQFFWLLVVLALIYFGIGKAMLPKIQSTVDARDKRVVGDLAAAQAARTGADETEAAYRARMDASRAEAMQVAQAARQASAKATEEKIQAANAQSAAKIEAAEARIRAATDAALADIETVAVEASQEMVERLTGLSVGEGEAREAVKAAMAHG
jgi:F-type H+-transporting ATPase subunit b